LHNDLASVDSQAHNWKTRLRAAPVLFLRQGSTEAWRAVWLSSKHLDVVLVRVTRLCIRPTDTGRGVTAGATASAVGWRMAIALTPRWLLGQGVYTI